MAYHDIVSVNAECLSCHADTVARRCLSCYRYIWSLYYEWALKPYYSRDIEDYDTCSTSLASLTQSAWSTVSERCDDINLSATSAKRVHAATLSTRESGNLCLWEISRPAGPWHVWSSLSMFFLHDRLTLSPHLCLMFRPGCLHRVNLCLCLLAQLWILRMAGEHCESQG